MYFARTPAAMKASKLMAFAVFFRLSAYISTFLDFDTAFDSLAYDSIANLKSFLNWAKCFSAVRVLSFAEIFAFADLPFEPVAGGLSFGSASATFSAVSKKFSPAFSTDF